MESTNSKFFTYLVGFSGLLISSVAAFFSVTGIAQLFSGSFWSVVVMTGSLEFGKLVAASFIYRYWNLVNWLQKMYTVIAVVILIGITSMGIFGFLSNSYMGATVEFESMITKLEVYKEQLVTLEDDKKFLKQELEESVNSLPSNYITAKRKLREEYNPKVLELNDMILNVKQDISDLKVGLVETGVDVGPAIYLARAFNTDIDTVVKFFIFILIFVFDPMAVSLIIAYNRVIEDEPERISEPIEMYKKKSKLKKKLSKPKLEPTITPSIEESEPTESITKPVFKDGRVGK